MEMRLKLNSFLITLSILILLGCNEPHDPGSMQPFDGYPFITSKEEIKEMHSQKRKRIVKVNKRAQHELNLWKQEKVIANTNIIFGIFNGKSSTFAQEMLAPEYSTPDPNFRCTTSFKDLGVEKKEIINKLVEKGVLPPDFHLLK